LDFHRGLTRISRQRFLSTPRRRGAARRGAADCLAVLRLNGEIRGATLILSPRRTFALIEREKRVSQWKTGWMDSGNEEKFDSRVHARFAESVVD